MKKHQTVSMVTIMACIVMLLSLLLNAFKNLAIGWNFR